MKNNRFPKHGWLGLLLIAVFWTLNWSLPGYRTSFCFFPLWLGYILAIDGLVYKRRGHSPATRNIKAFILMFFISIPAWWLFELFNNHLQNWHYLGADHYSDLEYALLSSLDFSTVIPAVFVTSELASTFKWLKIINIPVKIGTRLRTQIKLFALGWLMLAALLIWPDYFFPLVWLSVYFILEPVNVWFKNRNLIQYTEKKDWRPILALWIGCLITGFFWEMWNYYAYPKWVYELPYLDHLDIFEMPLAGFLGYLPFSLELFAIFHLISGIIKFPGKNYVDITRF
jgi:hypothetical protein